MRYASEARRDDALSQAQPCPTPLDGAIPREVLDALDDVSSRAPTLTGACCIDQAGGGSGTMRVRGDGEDIEIFAPAKLLRKVFATCDGSRRQLP